MKKTLYMVKSSKYACYYVFAYGYDEAARKALNKMLSDMEEEKIRREQEVFTEDNSLNPFLFAKDNRQEEVPSIKSVEIVTDEIID